MNKTITEIQEALKYCADEKVREMSSRFFKQGEEAKVYGVKAAEVRRIGKELYKQIKEIPKQEIFNLCETLWQSGYSEEALIACIFTEALHKKYKPSDFAVFEHWVKNHVSNWADCDTLCNHTIGTFIIMHPQYLRELKKWAHSSKRFVKRAAAVSLIIPARKGMFLKDIFEIADILLTDGDDLVQKGYGWMLKAASQAHQKEVFDYVMLKKDRMPRTALRYAIEKMPVALKAKAMER